MIEPKNRIRMLMSISQNKLKKSLWIAVLLSLVHIIDKHRTQNQKY